jgi:hypothetical protein
LHSTVVAITVNPAVESNGISNIFEGELSAVNCAPVLIHETESITSTASGSMTGFVLIAGFSA